MDACEIPKDPSSLRLLTTSGRARREGRLTLRRIGNTAKAGTAIRRWCPNVLDRSFTPARITPGVGDFHQLEIARDVLVIRGPVVELLQQLVNHMRLEALDLIAHRPDFLLP